MGFLLFMMAISFSSKTFSTPDTLFLTLEKACQYTLDNSYELTTARLDYKVAGKQIWETAAIGLPHVSGSVGYQYFTDIPTSLVPAEFFGGEPGEFMEIQFGTDHNVTAALNINQLIFDGSYIIGLRTARVFSQLAEENLQRTESEVINTVTKTYYLALMTRDNISLVSQNADNMEKTLHETKKLYEEGFTDRITVDQLRLTLSNMKNRLTSLERQHQVTLNLLKFQMGIGQKTPVKLTEDLTTLFEQSLIIEYKTADFNPENHIDFRIMQSRESLSLMNLRRHQSSYLPSISASFVRQESAMRSEFNIFDGGEPWFPTTFFGVNINIPVFSSGMRSSQVQQAKLELEKSKIHKDRVYQALKLEVSEAEAQFDNALKQYINEKENLELAEKILNQTTIKHREGMASSLELTQASDQMIATQANFLNAMFELLSAKNDLEKALGRL